MTSDLHLESRGSGPGLLVVGGWGLLSGRHQEAISSRWTEGRRLTVFDHPGLGASPPWPTGFTTRDIAHAVQGAIEANGESVDLIVGQGGLGAGVAMHLAAELGSVVQRMVLSAGWAGPEPYHDAQLRTMRTAREHSWEAFEELANVYCVPPEHFGPSIRHDNWHAPGSIRERVDAHLALIQANLTHDARAVLPGIASPTLVIAGEFDLLGGPRLGSEVAELMPDADQLVMAGHPHARGVCPDMLDEYREAIAAFLNGGDPR